MILLVIFLGNSFLKKDFKESKKEYGNLKIVKEAPKLMNGNEKNAEVYTINDSFGNQYEKRALINEGVMFDLPKGFEGKKENDTYYIYPSKNAKKNFSIMFAMRFYENADNKKISREEAKSMLMDRTKGEIKYISSGLSTEYNLSHLNRGKAKKMDDKLIYEVAKESTYSNPQDPTKILDLRTSFTYIPLAYTNVEISCISPHELKDLAGDINKAIVSSMTEYSPLPYNNTKALDKEIKTKNYSTKISSKYIESWKYGNVLLAKMSNSIFEKDYDMFLTIGTLDLKKDDKLDLSKTNPLLAKFVYASWFDFKDKGSVLEILESQKVKASQIDGHRAYLHDFILNAQNTVSSGAYDVLNPANITMYVVKINPKKVGYIAIRHSVFNNDLATEILKEIAKNTKFN